MRVGCKFAAVFLLPAALLAQSQPELNQILERLQRLEEQNKALMTEIHALREELAASTTRTTASPAPSDSHLDERVAVTEQRAQDLDQAKVEAEHKFPIRLTGMALFNAFANGRNSAGQQYPVVAASTATAANDGGTLRQSVIGFKFDGPQLPGGGTVTGSLYLDLWGGTASSLNQLVRLRVASIDLNWGNTTFSVGQDKPILAPREPTSLAQVSFSPLTAAGNLWLWSPQARIEHRFDFGEQAGLRAELGVYQTSESGTTVPSEYKSDSSRPALEGRFELWRQFANDRRLEIAPGFHLSESHVGGRSIPSRVGSVDWLIRPTRMIDVTGMFFLGENTSVLGGLRQSIAFFPYEQFRPVRGLGAWSQVTLRATSKLSFNIYGGKEERRNADVCMGCISDNLTYAGNFIYRLSSNVLASFEASQTRTMYLGTGLRLNPHYDLAIAYLY